MEQKFSEFSENWINLRILFATCASLALRCWFLTQVIAGSNIVIFFLIILFLSMNSLKNV